MAINEIALEEQLKEAGNRLLNPPSSIDELLNLLDELERLLVHVEQAPSRSMQDALLSPMKALISSSLLRHSEADVKVSVTSCISEITRITAPDAPYNDEQMKEIFQLIVSAIEKLSHVSSHGYTKAVLILDTIAKVRSCLIMLDLELDELIVEMFQIFLKIIRANHSHAVFLAMETIMTLVIDESDDLSFNLLNPLLTSLRKENQSVSPIAWKLVENVMTNCSAKLKPYLKEAVQYAGIALDEYSPIVASICQEASRTSEHGYSNGSLEHLVTKGISVCAGEVFQATGNILNSTTSNGTPSIIKSNISIDDNSEKMLEHRFLTRHSKSTYAQSNTEAGENLNMETVAIRRKRGRKPNSLMNSEEWYYHSWVSEKRNHGHKSCDKGIDDSPLGSSVPKEVVMSLPHVSAMEPNGFTPKACQVIGASPPSQKPVSGCSHPKRGRPKKKGFINNQDADPSSLLVSGREIFNSNIEGRIQDSGDASLKLLSHRRRNSGLKQQKHSRKIGPASKTVSNTPFVPLSVESVKQEILSEPEEKPPLKVRVRYKGADKSFAESDSQRRDSLKGTADDDAAEGSADKETTLSNRDGGFQNETLKKKLKRKDTPRKEVDSDTPDFGYQLLGVRIKVWWPMDKTFYEGVVDSYDPVRKRHRVPQFELNRGYSRASSPELLVCLFLFVLLVVIRLTIPSSSPMNYLVVMEPQTIVLYADGDEEVLNLRKQRWEIIQDHLLLDKGHGIDLMKVDASSEIMQKRKGKAKSESKRRPKTDLSLKRRGAAAASKTHVKSESKFADIATRYTPIIFDDPVNETQVDGGLNW